MLAEQAEEVDQILAVVADLNARVQARPGGVLDVDQRFGVLVPGGVRPLLELDDHEGVLAGRRVRAGQDGVDASAGQRQLVLHQHLDIMQARVGEVLREHGQAAGPRRAFGRAHAVPAHPNLLGDAVGQSALRGEAKKTGRGDAERRHGLLLPGSTK